MMRRWLAAAGVCVLGAGAQAADLKIVDIKASLYLESTGKFSEPLADAAELENLAKGDGPDRRLASAVLVELTFSGEKNAAPKFATATVDVTQTNHSGQSSVTHKGFTHFVFGPDGQWSDTVVGEGNLKLPAFVQALKADGFDGMAVIEYESDPQNPVPALKRCVEAMRSHA